MGLFRWMGIFAGYPWLALIPIAIFFVMGAKVRSRFVTGIALLWLIYGVYELLMKLRVLCSGDCDTRMDLLVIYPILLLASVVALAIAVPKMLILNRDRNPY